MLGSDNWKMLFWLESKKVTYVPVYVDVLL